MSTLDNYMDKIDSKKAEIAKTISLAFFDGDVDKAKEHFPLFYKRISETKSFVFRTNISINKNSYTRSVDELLRNISRQVGFNVEGYFYKSQAVAVSVVDNENNIPKDDLKSLKKAYGFYGNSFMKLGITYNKFLDFYREKGMNAQI